MCVAKELKLWSFVSYKLSVHSSLFRDVQLSLRLKFTLNCNFSVLSSYRFNAEITSWCNHHLKQRRRRICWIHRHLLRLPGKLLLRLKHVGHDGGRFYRLFFSIYQLIIWSLEKNSESNITYYNVSFCPINSSIKFFFSVNWLIFSLLPQTI